MSDFYYWCQSPFVLLAGEDSLPAIGCYGRQVAQTLSMSLLGRIHYMASRANLFVGAEDDRARLSMRMPEVIGGNVPDAFRLP